MKHPFEGKILITGGAGFIGSALIWALNQRGISNILVTDMLGTSEKWQNLAPLQFNDYMEADTFASQLQFQPTLFDDITCVLHLGANSATTETDARHLIENNFETTKLLAQWALGKEARFVYASSAATYGSGAQGMSDADTPENLHSLRPLNMYGYSKHLFDVWALRRGILGSIAGLKYFNVFGPNECHKGDMRSVVHKAYGQIESTGKVQLFKSYHPNYKDGEQQRDFLYVKDAVAMTLHLAETVEAGGLYNLGSGAARTWLNLVQPLFAAMGKPENIEFIDMPPHLKEKYQYHTCADIAKLRATGFTQELTPLAEAVTDYAQNYLLTGAKLEV